MIAWLGTALRRLRDERLSAVGLVALVFATALAAAAAPRLEARVADDTLLETIARAPLPSRHVQWLRQDRFETGGDAPLTAVDAIAKQLDALLPDRIRNLVSEQSWFMESGRWKLPEIVGDPATMRLRIQPDLDSKITLREGRWPTATITMGPDRTSDSLDPPNVSFFEIAISVPTAQGIGKGVDETMHVGDTLMLTTDSTDPLVGRGHPKVIGVTIVGTFEVNDETDPWWLGDTDVARPFSRSLGGDVRVTDTQAILAPEAYGPYLNVTRELFLPMRYTFREYVDPARLPAAGVADALVDLRKLESSYPSTNVTVNQAIALRTGLRTALETFQGQWASASALLTVALIGPGVVAIAALALIAILAAQRRRSALALARGRGASITQVTAAVIAEGVILAIPAAAAAILAALLLIRADPVLPSVIAGGAVAGIAILLLVIATVPATGGSSFGPAREPAVPRPPTPRRLVLEGLIVILAIAGAVLLRDRGVRGASSTGALGQVDPLIAAVPALVGVAAGLIAVRVLPLPIRLLAWLAARRRDLVPLLALRRATQATSTAPILIVLLATATIASFGAAVLVHLDRVSEASAWRTVGAAYRVDNPAGNVRAEFQPDAIPGVEASAGISRISISVGPRNLQAEFVAVQADAYDQVAQGTPADPHLPVDLFAKNPSVIPLVVSSGLVNRPDGLKIGDRLTINLEGHFFPCLIVAVRDDIPAFSRSSQFVVASRDQLMTMYGEARLSLSTVFLRAPDASVDAIRAGVTTQIPVGAVVTARAEVTRDARNSPANKAVVTGITAASLLAMIYAALAVAAAMALSGAARAVEIAHLRTLGLTDRQATGLVVIEHGPTVIVAFLAGLGLGVGLLAALRDGLGIEALVGSAPDISIGLEPGQLLLVLGGIVAVVVLGLGLGSWMQRRAAPIAAVRRGFE